MKKLYIEAGHGGKDPGAVSGSTTEASLTFEFMNKLADAYEHLGGIVVRDNKEDALAATLKHYAKTMGDNDLAISFHFDAATPTAHGHTIIVPEIASLIEVRLAKLLDYQLTKYSTSRGIIKPSQTPRGTLGWLKQRGICILVEICFMSNVDELANYKVNIDLIVKDVANTLSII